MSVAIFRCSRRSDYGCVGTAVELDDDRGELPVLPPAGWVETHRDELVCPTCATPEEVGDYFELADQAGAAIAEVLSEDRAKELL